MNDKKPDEQEQEKLDSDTHSLLDSLDDPIEEDDTPQDQEAAALLSSLEAIKPQTVTAPQALESDESTAPDEQEETEIVLDTGTHSLLDELDDDIDAEGNPQDAATTALLDSLDQIKPQTVAGTAQSEVESSGEDTDSIIYRYRIGIAVPHRLQQSIQIALQHVDLESPSTYFQWQADFQTEDIEAIETILQEWADEHLPIQTQIERVHSAVVGRQTYIAGWSLRNEGFIYRAQQALTTRLADHINPETTSNATFYGILPVSVDAPARTFPRLIAYLQREFEEEEWVIATVQLLRTPVDGKGEWEVVKEFR